MWLGTGTGECGFDQSVSANTSWAPWPKEQICIFISWDNVTTVTFSVFHQADTEIVCSPLLVWWVLAWECFCTRTKQQRRHLKMIHTAQPRRILLLFVWAKKQMYLEKKRLGCFFFWFYPTLTPWMQHAASCSNLFSSICIQGTGLCWDSNLNSRQITKRPDRKHISSWPPGYLLSLVPLNFQWRLHDRAFREFTIRHPDESGVRCRLKQANHNPMTFEFKFFQNPLPSTPIMSLLSAI